MGKGAERQEGAQHDKGGAEGQGRGASLKRVQSEGRGVRLAQEQKTLLSGRGGIKWVSLT